MDHSTLGRLTVITLATLLLGCTTQFPTISNLQPSKGELAYQECTVTILNTVLLGMFAWTDGCQHKTLDLK